MKNVNWRLVTIALELLCIKTFKYLIIGYLCYILEKRLFPRWHRLLAGTLPHFDPNLS